MAHHEIEKYRLRARIFHWVIAFSAFALAITGLILYVPQFGVVAQDGYTRIIHRVAAVLFVGSPFIYFLFSPGGSLAFLKKTFSWGKDDIEWIKAAPDYYFGGDEKKMPPQDEMNSGQKLFAIVAVACFVGFAVTGAIMWFFSGSVSPGVFNASLIIHDVFFIAGGAMLLVHIYLGAIHPRMTEALKSMISGKISVHYAKSHHGKWYKEVVGEEAAPHPEDEVMTESPT